MNDPPPDDEKGAVDAVTPTTPERDSFPRPESKNSGRTYALDRSIVNAPSVEPETRVSEAGRPGADYVTEAEETFFEICRERTGEELSPEAQEKRAGGRLNLLEQSHRMANALQSQGIKAYGESKLFLMGVCSGVVVELPDFRNIVFIPIVAQRKRNEMVKHLEFFLQENRYSRMWVFTSGDRTHLENVRDRVLNLHRRLSRLNAADFMKAAGAQLVFRSTELGEVKREEIGSPTFHVHAHTIVKLEKKLSKERWSELIEKVRKFWKFHFRDSKRIHQAREACKYVVKPGDLELLTDVELAELYHQLFRLHLVQCLGSLKKQKALIKDSKRKLVRRPHGKTMRWEAIENWNKSRAKLREEDDSEEGYSNPPEDWLICTLPPSFALSKRSEPLAVILNYSGKRIGENRKIKAIREICAEQFADDFEPRK